MGVLYLETRIESIRPEDSTYMVLNFSMKKKKFTLILLASRVLINGLLPPPQLLDDNTFNFSTSFIDSWRHLCFTPDHHHAYSVRARLYRILPWFRCCSR